MRQVLRKAQSGMTIIEVMIGAGLIVFVGLGVASLSGHISTINSQLNVASTAASIRAAVLETLASSQSWQRTLEKNPSEFDCLINNSDCRNKGQYFDVYDAETPEPLVSKGPGTGFDVSGERCTTFSATGTYDCPFRMTVKWEAVCPASGPCLNPQVRIVGDLVFKPAGVLADAIPFLNTHKYSFTFMRGEALNTLEGNCAALYGTYNPATKTCILPLVGKCPANTIVLGIKPDNTKECGIPMAAVSCPAGEVFRGVASDGTPYCSPMICVAYCLNPLNECGPQVPWSIQSDTLGGGGNDGSCDGSDGGDGGDGCDGGW